MSKALEAYFDTWPSLDNKQTISQKSLYKNVNWRSNRDVLTTRLTSQTTPTKSAIEQSMGKTYVRFQAVILKQAY